MPWAYISKLLRYWGRKGNRVMRLTGFIIMRLTDRIAPCPYRRRQQTRRQHVLSLLKPRDEEKERNWRDSGRWNYARQLTSELSWPILRPSSSSELTGVIKIKGIRFTISCSHAQMITYQTKLHWVTYCWGFECLSVVQKMSIRWCSMQNDVDSNQRHFILDVLIIDVPAKILFQMIHKISI